MPTSCVGLPLETANRNPKSGITTTLYSETASNGGVNPVSPIRKVLVWAAPVLGCVVLATFSHAQATTQSSSSAMVSSTPAGDADANIEPRRPSISEAEEASISVDPATLLPDLPPVPHANATLVGGTIEHLDHVRDRITVRWFGGGKETVLFDPRTQVYRGGKTASVADLREGERVYLDTILDGSTVFARTMRLDAARAGGETQGMVVKFRSDRGELTVQDTLTPNLVQVHVTAGTKVKQGDRAATVAELVPGSLVTVGFSSDGAGRNMANEISILALPGTRYTFAGDIVHIDLRSGLLVLNSSTDHKTYEVYLAPSVTPDDGLHAGANVTVVTNFDGARYVAGSITINNSR